MSEFERGGQINAIVRSWNPEAERLKHQIERAREWASRKSDEARSQRGNDPYWEGCVDAYDAVVAMLSESETEEASGGTR